jgi:hypothetical protein
MASLLFSDDFSAANAESMRVCTADPTKAEEDLAKRLRVRRKILAFINEVILSSGGN